jgi:hypothetical protein
MGKFSRFYVFHSEAPEPGHKYRQVVAHRSDDGSAFEVRIFQGDVIRTEPDFKGETADAEHYFHATEEAANKDADDERDRCLATGWVLYQAPQP